jgi:hypothetical protein
MLTGENGRPKETGRFPFVGLGAKPLAYGLAQKDD